MGTEEIGVVKQVTAEWVPRVESLGARWLELGIESGGEGGDARELTEQERARLQQALIVQGVEPGGALVDLAGETVGSCELIESGPVAVVQHVLSGSLRQPMEALAAQAVAA